MYYYINILLLTIIFICVIFIVTFDFTVLLHWLALLFILLEIMFHYSIYFAVFHVEYVENNKPLTPGLH